jgi:hypothetical protein
MSPIDEVIDAAMRRAFAFVDRACEPDQVVESITGYLSQPTLD